MVENNKEHRREVFPASVDELCRTNPQIDIFNTVVYEDMRRAFSLELYDPVNLARVRFEDGSTVWAIVDGHTKVKFAKDHGKEHGIKEVEVYDSTIALKRNPRIVPIGEGSPDGAITMAQYLRAVIEPTKVHQDIAARRIAAHFINGWHAIVGEKLSEKFPATAALSMLADIQASIVTDAALQKTLRSQDVLIDRETRSERELVENALTQIASIIKNTSLKPTDVYREAFMLVSSADPIIGGEPQAAKELYGILNMPAVSDKIGKEIRQTALKEQAMESLRKATIRSLGKVRQLHQEPGVVADIVRDTELTYKQTLVCLQSENPSMSYDKQKAGLRLDKINILYKKINEGKEPSGREARFIDRFSKLHLRAEDLQTVARMVYDTNRMLAPIDEFLKYAATNRELLLKGGIREKDLSEAVRKLTEGLDKLYDAESHYQLRSQASELRSVVYQQINERLTQQKQSYKASTLFDEYLLGKLEQEVEEKTLPAIKSNACLYLLDFEDGLFNEAVMQKLFQSLSSLDSELLLKVLDKRTTLDHALLLYRSKHTVQTPLKPSAGDTKSTARTVFSSGIKIEPRRSESAGQVVEPIKIRKSVEEFQNQELSKLLRGLFDKIESIDLDPKTTSEENKKTAWEIVNKLVIIINGHPDARRIIEIEYPKLQGRLDKEQKDKVSENMTRGSSSRI